MKRQAAKLPTLCPTRGSSIYKGESLYPVALFLFREPSPALRGSATEYRVNTSTDGRTLEDCMRGMATRNSSRSSSTRASGGKGEHSDVIFSAVSDAKSNNKEPETTPRLGLDRDNKEGYYSTQHETACLCSRLAVEMELRYALVGR